MSQSKEPTSPRYEQMGWWLTRQIGRAFSFDAGLAPTKRSPASKPLSMRLTPELEHWLDQKRGDVLSRSAMVRVVLQRVTEQQIREERQ